MLAAAEGLNNTEIAERLGVGRGTVTRWRSRFAEDRLDGLCDEPRPGQPRKITDEKVEQVIAKTLESTPKDATHWSTRSMAKEVGLSQTAISQISRRLGSGRTVRGPGSCPGTRCSSKRSVTLSACT